MGKDRNLTRMLGELETEIMEIVWLSKNPVSVRSVAEILQGKRPIAYTTVMTIMGRLVDKGVLVRKLNRLSYLYRSKVSRENFTAKSVHNIFTTAVSTLGQEAVTHFLKEVQKVNPKKRYKLLKILDRTWI